MKQLWTNLRRFLKTATILGLVSDLTPLLHWDHWLVRAISRQRPDTTNLNKTEYHMILDIWYFTLIFYAKDSLRYYKGEYIKVLVS